MKQLHIEFQNLKQIVIIKVYHKEIKTEKAFNSNFFSRKNLKQKQEKFQYYAVCKLKNLIYFLNDCYHILHILSYTKNLEAVGFRPHLNQTNFYPSWLSVGITSIILLCHVCCNLVKVLQKFCKVGSICEGNVFMLKTQAWWWRFTLYAWHL